MRSSTLIAAAMLFCVAPAGAQQVGEIGVDWFGNDIIVEAIRDPAVDGVTCHVSYFERGMVDRLQKGNWFEDPSDTSISCRQTGAIRIGEHRTWRGRGGSLQPRHQPDLEETGREPRLRQSQ